MTHETPVGDPKIFKPLLAIVATTVLAAAIAGYFYRASVEADRKASAQTQLPAKQP